VEIFLDISKNQLVNDSKCQITQRISKYKYYTMSKHKDRQQ